MWMIWVRPDVFALERQSALPNDSPEDDQSKPLAFLNVNTGVDHTIKGLAETVAIATGYEGVIQWGTTKLDGTPKKQLDVRRMQSLGWSAKILLTEGLVSTMALIQGV